MKEQIKIIQEIAWDMLKNDKLQGKTKIGLKGIIQACEEAITLSNEVDEKLLWDAVDNGIEEAKVLIYDTILDKLTQK